MIELAAARGYEALTVRALAKRARISSGTFYSHYRSTDECLLATFDRICRRTSQRLVEVGRNEPDPRRRLAVAVARLFQDMAASPEETTFMLRAAPAVGPAFTSGLRNSEMRLGIALEFCTRRDGDSPPSHPLLLEGIVTGLVRIGRVLGPTSGEEEIRGVAADAVEWILSLSAPSAQDAKLPRAAAAAERGNGIPAPQPDSDWEEAFGDERAMILTAAFRIARGGYHQLSVRRICREAGVSRREFSRHFKDLDDCFISALEERAGAAIAAAVRSQPASGSWSCAVYEALSALCSAIEADRESARVLFVEITAAGTQGIDCRDRLISQAAEALRTTAPEGRDPSELAAEASSAAAWAILRRQVQDKGSPIRAVLPVLALLMLAPATASDQAVPWEIEDKR